MVSAVNTLPLLSTTPAAWARAVLKDPIALLVDHAFLERKAATNALDLMSRWPHLWTPGWVEAMTSVARDETAHLARVTRILIRRGGRLAQVHKNPYANALRLRVRKGVEGETLDRVLVSALIEARSCERFGVLARHAEDPELERLYRSLYASERSHYKVFLRMGTKIAGAAAAGARWKEMLAAEAEILAAQEPGPRIHSGVR
jgi:tRNA-(ms[2]io[6]A)-hydroxylase